MSDESRRFYGVQFHPEVTHTTQGSRLLERFVREIAGSDALWSVGNIIEDAIERVREQVGTGKVLLGLSGGVDSSVVAALLRREHERRLGKVELRRRDLHGSVGDAPAIAEDRELVATELPVGEDVDERVVVTRHDRRATASRTSSMNRSNTGSLSRGPGAPSGWY